MTNSPSAEDSETPLTSLPSEWNVWNRGDDGRLVLAYRPDVFNGDDFPPACLPTLYLTHGARTRRPGTNPANHADDDWYVTLYLEPDVSATTERFANRNDALEYTLALATEFDDGDVDYRELYQVPRETYFERLDELVGEQ
ncbi:hypothetical protein SAMN04487967_0107 [Natronorubrum sediminis]|uniref:Uncharacterized protein n=1 Tax=Natronorubrum sediminis TaxID=640943 RepID=A0A1H6FJ75_9EURY|nr:DUF5820 family protein [Natronorubrum sediminis]SEH10907.1 hypothetical protein SAMN04487967_0107 [Natronorubrum sediminis]